MKKNYTFHIILVFFVLIFGFSTMAAVNINTIIEQMKQSYQRQMSEIDDITIIQEMKGGFLSMEGITYQKKARINNQEVYKSRSETRVMGMDTVTIFDGIYTWSIDPVSGEVKKEEGGVDPLQVWKVFDPGKMEFLGEEKVDGKDAYKVQLDDAIWMMGKEDLASSGMPEDSEVDMHSIYWIDKNDYVPLKSLNFMKTTTIEDGKPVTMNMITDVQFLDYRRIESMLISYRMVISNQMEVDDPSLSQEEKEQAKAFMSSMGNMEFVVKNVEINTGLPDTLFDGTKLEPGEPMFGGTPGSSQDTTDFDGTKTMTQEDIEAMMESLQDMLQNIVPTD